MYLWIKAFHIITVVTWFAGLFYLPRLFVYHAMASDDPLGMERFKIMESLAVNVVALHAQIAGATGKTRLDHDAIANADPARLRDGNDFACCLMPVSVLAVTGQESLELRAHGRGHDFDLNPVLFRTRFRHIDDGQRVALFHDVADVDVDFLDVSGDSRPYFCPKVRMNRGWLRAGSLDQSFLYRD